MASEHKLVQATEAGHTSDDNRAPADPYLVQLEEDNAALIREQTDLELAAAALPVEVKSDEDVAAITAWVVKAQGLARRTENKRVADKEPLLARTRTLDSFFAGIRDGLKNRAASIERRNGPYLLAKQARLEAEARARAEAAQAEVRRLAEIAAAARQREEDARQLAAQEQERNRRAAAEAEAQETTAALQAAADEDTGAPVFNLDAAREANEAEESARQAEVAAQAAGGTAAKADEAAAAAQKVADKAERGAEQGHKLARTGGGGGSVNVRKVFRGEVTDWPAVGQSLGAWRPYLSKQAVLDAVAKAAREEIPPAIPGVTFTEETKVSTTAARKS